MNECKIFITNCSLSSLANLYAKIREVGVPSFFNSVMRGESTHVFIFVTMESPELADKVRAKLTGVSLDDGRVLIVDKVRARAAEEVFDPETASSSSSPSTSMELEADNKRIDKTAKQKFVFRHLDQGFDSQIVNSVFVKIWSRSQETITEDKMFAIFAPFCNGDCTASLKQLLVYEDGMMGHGFIDFPKTAEGAEAVRQTTAYFERPVRMGNLTVYCEVSQKHIQSRYFLSKRQQQPAEANTMVKEHGYGKTKLMQATYHQDTHHPTPYFYQGDQYGNQYHVQLHPQPFSHCSGAWAFPVAHHSFATPLSTGYYQYQTDSHV